ncbi:hypothetical protein PtB15_11B341 [Puccinia triticina]|nr:hypothetical protein PtB15_11B341 [Puccinia triticina]
MQNIIKTINEMRVQQDPKKEESDPRAVIGKSFPLFHLAEDVFLGTVASGELADTGFPGYQEPELPVSPPEAPQLNHKKALATLKRQLAMEADVNEEEDLGNSAQPSPSQPIPKRIREGKNDILSNGITGLISAIGKASEGSKDLVGAMLSIASNQNHSSRLTNTSPTTNKSSSECALEKLQQMFGDDIPDNEFVDYISIIEDNSKARTFLKLVQTTSPNIVQKWLAKEVLVRTQACAKELLA